MSSEATASNDRAPQFDFDPDALREKYRIERDKRLRVDGNEQYVEVKGDFAHYVDDPYVARQERPAIDDTVEVLIIGGGFGGLLAGARLRQAGVDDLRIVEKGGDFGGTWYWNRYPGAMCDIEAYIYLPLCEELGYVPKEKYTRAPEMLAHSRAIGEHFDLYRNACFQTEVTDLRWDEDAAHWAVETNRGDRIRARYVCMANGPLNRPKLPGIPGIDTYRGHTFHTSRWDYEYTGGDADGGLDRLRDKRVGIIGTGATAVQCVPHLGESAQELFVFQRTPSSVDVRNNRPTDPEWANALKSGWQTERMRNFNILVQGGFQEEDLVSDGWTDIIRNLGTMVNKDKEQTSREFGQQMELADFQKMEEVRARAEAIVQDPNTAESLKPYYRQFCKRPCFHDEYLQTFNRPNVTLVDTDGKGVERITENGVVVDGKEYELDCIVFATGFEVGTSYTRRAGYDVAGRDGQTLSEKFDAGVSTLHGIHSRGFPNLFFMAVGMQNGFTANFPHALSEMSTHIAYIIKEAGDRQLRTVEAGAEAEAEWVETIRNLGRQAVRFQTDCTPGYYNNEGQPTARSLQNGAYGAGSEAFFELMKQWREAGELSGLELANG